jgi:hypothetical protein
VKSKRFIALFLTVIAVTPWLSGTTLACKIGENMGTQLPFDSIDISNADRLVIANMYIEAKKWPDVRIRAEVIAGAYKSEHNIERLKEVRGENVRAYLLALGIKSENILIVKKTFTDAMATKAPDGSVTVEQIWIGLAPLCEGSCARLCDDPRVIPKSKLINR